MRATIFFISFLILPILFGANLHSETIKGIVFEDQNDGGTNKDTVLAGAKVTLTSSNAEATASGTGLFSFEVASTGTYLLKAEFNGYQTQTFDCIVLEDTQWCSIGLSIGDNVTDSGMDPITDSGSQDPIDSGEPGNESGTVEMNEKIVRIPFEGKELGTGGCQSTGKNSIFLIGFIPFLLFLKKNKKNTTYSVDRTDENEV